MKVLDPITRLGNTVSPKTEAERRAGLWAALAALIVLAGLYYYLV